MQNSWNPYNIFWPVDVFIQVPVIAITREVYRNLGVALGKWVVSMELNSWYMVIQTERPDCWGLQVRNAFTQRHLLKQQKITPVQYWYEQAILLKQVPSGSDISFKNYRQKTARTFYMSRPVFPEDNRWNVWIATALCCCVHEDFLVACNFQIANFTIMSVLVLNILWFHMCSHR